MVFYTDTFELCHALTEYGKENYRMMLEDIATEILDRTEMKKKHPFQYMRMRINELIAKLKDE